MEIIIREKSSDKVCIQDIQIQSDPREKIAQKGRKRERENAWRARGAGAEYWLSQSRSVASPPSTRGDAVRPAVSWLELPDSQLIRCTPPWWRNRRRIAVLAPLLSFVLSTILCDRLAFSSSLPVSCTHLIALLKCNRRKSCVKKPARLWKRKIRSAVKNAYETNQYFITLSINWQVWFYLECFDWQD